MEEHEPRDLVEHETQDLVERDTQGLAEHDLVERKNTGSRTCEMLKVITW